MTALLFLDIDGVLNGHRQHQGRTIDARCVAHLNRILTTGCKVVLSSAWRYMIHGKQMSLKGFGYMLHTHGVVGLVRGLIGLTVPDEQCVFCGHKHPKHPSRRWLRTDGKRLLCRRCGREPTRGEQITHWLKSNAWSGPYCVLDDQDLGISACGHPFVQTSGRHGLSRRTADAVISRLSD